jgi:catechol 2,3-dioxygenase-like lactoylglutathione lyase family enzyme
MTISGAMPTIFVSNMDTAVRFYTDALGLKLRERHGDHWASIDCGQGVTIGLHPASARNPAGRVGSMTIGFRSSEPIREAVATLKARGVVFQGDVIDDTQLLIANFQDPDGNPFYLAEPKAWS